MRGSNLFLPFLYYRRRNKRLRETAVSMLSRGAFEKSNKSYIESILEAYVSKNQKGILTMWIWWERISWKNAEATEKSIHELKAEFVCVCVCEKKNSFEIHVIILRYMRNVNLPFKKDFKIAELLSKISFFLYFRDRPKNGEGNKQRRRQNYMCNIN